ncbi:MAG TPA: rhomboid family intramembrane serine protease, partial [Solirubrobacteraceae bacterium]|nr:rhomboid family intramembrane serine protease [Solirubrobacteraceae bacterium]
LEPALGRLRFGLIYAVSLLTGSLGALIVSPHAVTVGASGAVFGVMGAAAVEMRARQIPIMQSGVGGLILINLVISFTLPGISWGGHVGGLIGGALAALAFQASARVRAPWLALVACVAIGVAAFAGSIAVSKSSEAAGSAPIRLVEPR